jgi:DNA primase large subunit
VNSDKKALELAAILEAVHPTHAQRLWLCGFLRFVGYHMDDVSGIIHEHNHWCDYDVRVTSYQVATIFKQKPRPTQNHSAPRPRKWSLTPTEILRIKYQRSVSLNKILCDENKEKTISFPHPERLAGSGEFNPSAIFLRK